MAVQQIRGSTQIMSGTITNTEINASANIALSKLEEAVIQADGGQAFTADQSMGSNKLTNLANGTASTDAVNKGQLDAAVAGLAWKDAVLTSDGGDLSSATLSFSSPTLTISGLTAGTTLGQLDGVEPTTDDRVLILDAANAGTGADAALNGIWVITGGTTTSLTMTRATDMDASGEFTSAAVFVRQGTTYADTGWTQTAEITTVNTDTVSFTQFTGAATLTAGDGIDIVGNTISTDLAASGGLKIVSTELAVEPTDFAGTGLEDDGSDNLRLATQGNGIAGGGGTTLSVDSDTETGGNILGVNVTANGVGVDVSSLAGTGIAANGTALDVDGTVFTDSRYIVREVPTGLINDSNTTYTLANTPQAGTEQVYLNGILQNVGGSNDYTISGGTITYNTAPSTNDVLLVTYITD